MARTQSRSDSGAPVGGIARWNPEFSRFDPFLGASHQRTALARLLTDAVTASPWIDGGERLFAPALDVYENERTLTFRVDLPGVAKKDVKVQIEEGILSIAGERDDADVRDDLGTCQRMERRSGAFYRSLTLPPSVDADGVIAEYVDGVLTVRVPKRENGPTKDVMIR